MANHNINKRLVFSANEKHSLQAIDPRSLSRRKHGAAGETIAASRSHVFKLRCDTELSETRHTGDDCFREPNSNEMEAQRLSGV